MGALPREYGRMLVQKLVSLEHVFGFPEITRERKEMERKYGHAKCPECQTSGYLVLPSYGNCQTCLGLRLGRISRW